MESGICLSLFFDTVFSVKMPVLSTQDRDGHQQFRTSIIPGIYSLRKKQPLVNSTRPLEGSITVSHVLILTVQLLWVEPFRIMISQAWLMPPTLESGGRPVPPAHMDQEEWE